MTSSIKTVGQYRYATVCPGEEDRFWIIDGLRNINAAKDAGFTEVSCVVLNVDRQRAFEIMQVLNSGHRKVTYAMKAKKLELIEKHAKRYLKENGTGDNEASDLTVRQYMATILGMSETYVSDFKAVCAHPESTLLLDQMDTRLISLKKAAAIARNKSAKVPELKKTITQGQKQEFACAECPRRKKFQDEVDNYGDMASDVANRLEEEETEDCHD